MQLSYCERDGDLQMMLSNEFQGGRSIRKGALSKGGIVFRNLELDTVTCMSVVNVRSLEN